LDQLERVKRALAGHYHFERELGKGAFATVFIARDLRHERLVAIKLLHIDPSSELNQVRFLREIRFLASLQHPNIVPVHDSGHVEDLLYYVMPYVRGETVRERIRRERQLPIPDATGICLEIADALDYAHQQGVIHRDIKPENILLSASHAVLADFGIARAIDSSRSGQITRTGFGSPGTPPYMSPEQLLGESQVDHRADIYSLGCVLFEMLTGVPPFEGPNGSTMRFTESAPSARAKRRGVSGTLDGIIAKALARSPGDRFSTAAQMRDALSAATMEARISAESLGQKSYPQNPIDQSLPSRGSWLSRSFAGAVKPLRGLSSPQYLWAAGLVAVLLALGGAQAAGLFRRSAVAATASDSRRIAVLDFDDQSQDHKLGHIATGLAVSLIHELNGVNGLQVVSRNSVQSFRERRYPVDSLVSILRVGTFVEGAVQMSGDRLRVTVGLVDARTETQLASTSVERPMGELFLLEDDVAHEVASLLRRRLGVQVHLREISEGTKSARARDLVFQAEKLREDATSRPYSGDLADVAASLNLLRRSDSLLAAAERADRNWITPVASRGLVALELARRQSGAQQAESFQRAIDLADRVLERDSTSGAAFELRGTALYRQATNLDLRDVEFSERLTRSEADLQQALSLDSTLATAWGSLSIVRFARGEVASAMRAAQTALSMDTYLKDAPAILTALYAANLISDDLPASHRWCERGAHDYPSDPQFMECQLTLLAEDNSRRPDPRLAWALFARADSVDPPAHAAATGRAFLPIYRRMTVAAVLARAGERDSARAVGRGAERAAGSNADLRLDLTYELAYLHLLLGERAEAIRLLSEYLAARPSLRSLVSKHPRWRPLKNDPAFSRLVASSKNLDSRLGRLRLDRHDGDLAIAQPVRDRAREVHGSDHVLVLEQFVL
jgi:serine/threonine protein kinase/tetratricopeptide (TPR) repeat protein